MLFSKFRKERKMNKKGVFGLTAVNSFIVLLLSVALLAYIVITIMGVLLGANIIQSNATGYNESKAVLTSVSSGISTFFTAINPVYSILAVMIIILVLIVIVKIVTPGNREATPQL